MPNISLTTFVDFVLKSGTPRITCVRNAKNLYEEGYTPAFDYWRQLREAIVDLHVRGLPKRNLDNILNRISDQRKRVPYSRCVASYKRWMGRKAIEWEDTFSDEWSSSGLTVRINPELGLNINGSSYIVKLYFRKDELSKRRLETTLHLLRISMPREKSHSTPAILDVQKGKLISSLAEIPDIDALVEGEAAALVTMWEQL